jgi:histone H3/H4
MGPGEVEKKSVGRFRISPDAFLEVENALRDYEQEVREAADARDGIAGTTVKKYTDGPEKFVAWLRYAFALAPSSKGRTPPRREIAALRIYRPVPKKSRISLQALAEAEAAFEDFLRELLRAEKGEMATN